MAGATGPKPCTDGAYTLHNWKWYDGMKWRYNIGSTPSDAGGQSAVDTAVRQGTNEITLSINDCGWSDLVSAQHSYEGTTSDGVDWKSDWSGCKATGDGKNRVKFSNPTWNSLARTCTWYVSISGVNKAVESDIAFNKAKYKWDPTGSCQGNGGQRYSVRAVMAHERGHTYGINHVGENNHPNLTMSTRAERCSDIAYTLGKGDMLALRNRY